MGARDFLTVIRKYWLLVAVCTLLGGLVAGLLSTSATPMFRSKASLYFSLQFGESAGDLNQGSTYTQNQMQSFAQLATSSIVLEPVVERLELGTTPADLARALEATTPDDTSVLEVTMESDSADEAAAVANAVAQQLSTTVARLAPQNAEGDATVEATVIDPAEPPQFQFAPNTRRNVAGGLIGGALLGALLAAAWSRLDTRVRTTDDLAEVTDIPLIGTITRYPRKQPAGLVMQADPQGPVAELYRRIRTNLRFLAVDQEALSLLVTSTAPGEGKSTTAANLAVALAESDLKVLLIDADLRRPAVGRYLEIEDAAGLTTVLIGRADVEDVTQQWGAAGLEVLPAGEIPPNPSELLASRAMESLVAAVRERYDVVLVDCAPVSLVADASILAPLVTGTIVVADASSVRRRPLTDAIEALTRSGAQIVGVVLNKVAGKPGTGYGYTSDVPDRADQTAPAGSRRRSRDRGARVAADPFPSPPPAPGAQHEGPAIGALSDRPQGGRPR